jgi:hypothetical protein
MKVRNSDDLGLDSKIILKWILGWKSVEWVDLVQDRDQWRTLANMVIKFLLPEMT